MKQITTGILAHVDAGKTTLSEGMLYCSGEIRTLGRVDNQNSFLDTDEIERKKGITVFSKQAVMSISGCTITLLDTPGHIDFSAEMERTLQVLDYAILVISATDGIQAHTKTLWDLLEKYNIPTFIFVNKMDLQGINLENVIGELKKEFSANIINFAETNADVLNENIALCDERIMESYLTNGQIFEEDVVNCIYLRKLFPLFCGAALKMDGVEKFLKAFARLTKQKSSFPIFGAKVFKISQDDKGQRLTFLKVTGGQLKVKDVLKYGDYAEKVNEIRIYSGDKYKNIDCAESGFVCAVTGLTKTYAGQGLGFEGDSDKLTAEPIFNYRVILPGGTDTSVALSYFKCLQEEETQLNVVWNESLKEIEIRLMGEIQLEVLKQMIFNRFGIWVEFEEGRLVYKETIENTVEGVGHYEPLRHYAEVHLVIEPLKRGLGIQFAADCPEDILDKNWQRLIMTHLMEKTHIGVLTGSPITDVKITLKSGAAHLKHTEGGDFRQATYRAVRQGLMSAKSVLLEPYYEFLLEVPGDNIGRAMTDLNSFGAKFDYPETRGSTSKLRGTVPASAVQNYQRELISYTHGKGKLYLKFCGYDICRNPEAVIDEIGYNAESDTENAADSVFCSHGAGFNVKWNEVPQYMHLESAIKAKKSVKDTEIKVNSSKISATDEELIKIFERTYGKIERKNPNTALRTPKTVNFTSPKIKKTNHKYDKEYLLIDGYNIIFAWEELKALAKDNLESARSKLIERIAAYKLFRDVEIIVVFDAYLVKGNIGNTDTIDGVCVVYTKEAQTADSYIEKTAKELSKNYKVTVATSDNLEQMIIFGSGAYRLSAKALYDDVCAVENNIRSMVKECNIKAESTDIMRVLREKLEEFE